MRILFAGGGTGGHIYPLVAVSRQLYKESKKRGGVDLNIVFVGPADKNALQIFNGNGIKTKRIITGKWRRYFSLWNIFDAFKILLGLTQSFIFLLWHMPHVVFSKGGYGSFPVVIAARLFGIPIIIHESDSISGAANRVLARLADKIIISFPGVFEEFGAQKVLLLGNPVRDFAKTDKQSAVSQLKIQTANPVLLFLGGSQGALEMNTLILSAIKELTDLYEIIHQTGDKHYKSIVKYAEKNLPKNNLLKYHVFASLNEVEMRNAFAAADIVVSRAGAGAIFEIAQQGKPSILIPYEAASGGHQYENARFYEKYGACIILSQSNIAPHIFLNQLERIIKDKRKTDAMSRAALGFAKPDAARNIASLLLEYGPRKTKNKS